MKKGMLFLGMLCLSVAALGFQEPGAPMRFFSTWAALKEGGAPSKEQLTRATEQAGSEMPLDLNEKKTLLPKMMKGETLRVQIIMPPDEVALTNKQMEYKWKVTTSLNGWLYYTSNEIKARCQTDKKCLDSFENVNSLQTNVKFVPENKEADLIVYLDDDLEKFQKYVCEHPDCFGVVNIGNEYIPMTLSLYRKVKMPIWYHEFGHVLGLSDMYPSGFKEGADKIVRSVNQERTRSIMDSTHDGIVPQFGCEDADGLINLVDQWTIYFEKAKHGTDFEQYLPARLKDGWQSFCPEAEWYKPLEMTKKIEEGAL